LDKRCGSLMGMGLVVLTLLSFLPTTDGYLLFTSDANSEPPFLSNVETMPFDKDCFDDVKVTSSISRIDQNYVGTGHPINVPEGYVASNIFSTALVAPWDLVFGPDGDLYVAEFTASRVSKVALDGSVSTYVEIPEAFLGHAKSLVFSPSDDLYISISSNGEGEFDGILKVFPNRTVTVFAEMSGMNQLAIGPSGDIFVANTNQGEISKITPEGVMTTFAYGLSEPLDLEFNSSGYLFVFEAGSGEISKITSTGIVTPFASGFTPGEAYMAFDTQGDLLVVQCWPFYRVFPNGTVISLEHFPDPVPDCYKDIIFDSLGNLYVAGGTASRILKVFPDNTVNILVDGFESTGLSISPSGDIFAINTASIRGDPPSTDILKLSINGTITNFATVSGIASDIDFDASGDLYVTIYDEGNILKIDPEGEVSTFLTGLNDLGSLAFSPSGNLFVLESYTGNIIRITPTLENSIFANGFITSTGWWNPSLAVDSMGNVFVGYEGENNTVYKIFPNRSVTIFATGISDTGFWDHGDITISPDGEIFATEAGPGKLYKITKEEVTTFATGLVNDPHSITCNPSGELIIARSGSIVKISELSDSGINEISSFFWTTIVVMFVIMVSELVLRKRRLLRIK